MQEMQVPSLLQEDPLEKEMATHSSILAWAIPRTEEPGGLWSMGSQSQTRLKQLSSSSNSRVFVHLGHSAHFGHLMRRADSFEKTLMLGGIRGRRKRG